MKMVHAVIKPEKLEDVKRALESAGFVGITVYEVRGRGRQLGISWRVRGHEYRVDMLPKLKIELVVPDEEVDKAVKVIMESARTGDIGDGKIFVHPIDQAIRIRTGESGVDANKRPAPRTRGV